MGDLADPTFWVQIGAISFKCDASIFIVKLFIDKTMSWYHHILHFMPLYVVFFNKRALALNQKRLFDTVPFEIIRTVHSLTCIHIFINIIVARRVVLDIDRFETEKEKAISSVT